MENRRQMILDKLEDNGSVRVNELSRELNCSAVTIRTDIRELEKAGKLTRVHGGAVRLEKEGSVKDKIPVLRLHVEQKKKIAEKAYEYINNQDMIILDDSSTCYYLGCYIRDHSEKNVTIVTNSLLTAYELAGIPHVNLNIVGGHVSGTLSATVGNMTLETLEHAHVNKAFIGAHGVNLEIGLTSIGSSQMEIKKAIIKAADEVTVLADSSKFGGGYLSVVCPLTDISRIITDDGINEEQVKCAKELGVNLVC
ncbi:transcriptional regulator, DeoR family [Lachnospiraceae bacterium]|nr:transcriptional regulator, DeoR family [Lachnospiraceae bacterium]